MPSQIERLISLRRQEIEVHRYPTSSRWYTSLSNAISYLERAETADDDMERFREAWDSAYNLFMLHGIAGDEEFKSFNRWVSDLVSLPEAGRVIQKREFIDFRERLEKAKKALLFDNSKKRWREGYQLLESWEKERTISTEKAIRYFLIIVRDIRNACSHPELNPNASATRHALASAASCLILMLGAAIPAMIEHPVAGTTGRTTAYRSFLWPFLKNSDSFFSDYYLERLFPTEDLQSFPEDEARNLLKDLAKQYQAKRETLMRADAEETREHWCKPVLFSSLGIKSHPKVRIVSENGIFEPSFVIARSDLSGKPRSEYQGKDAGRDLACLVWVLPWRVSLDAVLSHSDLGDLPAVEIAHRALVASDALWAVLTNGQQLRLLHKSTAHKPRSYVDMDLTAILDVFQGHRQEADALRAFRYCLGLFSGSSFTEKDEHEHSRLERVLMESERHGREIGEELKENVFHALEALGDGFLHYLKSNPEELENWRREKALRISAREVLASEVLLTEIYHESLSLMYRLLFLFYAESRNLLPMEDEMYSDTYSLESIRNEIIAIHDDPDPKHFFSQGETALWERLKELFNFVNEGWRRLIPVYNGGLFDPEKHLFMERFRIGDFFLARAIDMLSRTKPRSGQQAGEGRKKVTYRDLDVRHLGSIYEGILEYSSQIASDDLVVMKRGTGGKIVEEYVFVNELNREEKEQMEAWKQVVQENPDNPKLPRGCKISGFKEKGRYFLVYGGRESKRKSSGSYYTPDYIVQYIVENTLGPLLSGGNRDGDMKDVELTSDEILELKVLDPAMGSGHFLVAATEYLARAYGEALIKEGKDNDGVMSDEEFIRYKRKVAERCIYGVDINSMAVELYSCA